MQIWVKSVLDKGNRRCKGFEVGDNKGVGVGGVKSESSRR